MRVCERWCKLNKVVIFDTSSSRRFEMSVFLLDISICKDCILGTNFGICRCKNEALVVGEWIRTSAKA